jgi:serine/threonine protein kinase
MNFKKFPFYDFAKHLLEGLALLTLHGITHLDLHRGNILVDTANIPRIIDFNLSIDKSDTHNLVNRLKHSYQLNLTQESPDFLLVNAVHIGKEANWVISDMLKNKEMLQTLRKVLGTTEVDQRNQITEFYKESTVAQKGDLEGWFTSYWSYNDSWAGGCILVKLIAALSLWPSFERGDFALAKEKLFNVIRRMTHMSPIKRFDSVQALAFLDPENYILRTYATEWLKKRPAV